MKDSYSKMLWLTHAPKALLTYWIGVAIYCIFKTPDPTFISMQIACSISLLWGTMTGYYQGIRDCSTRALECVKDMEQKYTITFTRRDKDE